MLSTIAFVALALSCAVQAVFLLIGKSRRDYYSRPLLAAAGALLVAELVRRSLIIGFVAITGTFEALTLFAAAVSLLLFAWRLLAREKTQPIVLFIGSFIAFALLALASSPLVPKDVLPPVPALRSGWLVLHISLAFAGEAFFALSFGAALAWLLTGDAEKRARLDRLIYTSILIGYPVYTAGALIFGAIWAYFAWGSFWSWDAKEVWALVTWLVYTLYLHLRLIRKTRGTLAVVVALVGFPVAIFTVLGVNFLLSSLHSYS
jgi:ABC-type transport system involved in cytochrome c biogenesis permease subunit